MPLEFLHTTLGVTFLAVLAVVSQIIIRDHSTERTPKEPLGEKDQARKK